MVKKWFISAFSEIEKISQNLRPNLDQKWWKIEYLMKSCIGSRKASQNRVSFFRYILRSWRSDSSSAFLEIEKISENPAPNLGQKLWRIGSLLKRCIGPVKSHRTVFLFFARCYNAEEEIHKRISWNCENISKSRAQNLGQKWWKSESLMKRCIGSAKLRRTAFSLFPKILRCWRSDSSAHFLKLRKYLNICFQC